MKRRNFLQKAALGSVGITALGSSLAATAAIPRGAKDTQDVPVSLSYPGGIFLHMRCCKIRLVYREGEIRPNGTPPF